MHPGAIAASRGLRQFMGPVPIAPCIMPQRQEGWTRASRGLAVGDGGSEGAK